MNVCRPVCQGQRQFQLKDDPNHSDAFLNFKNQAEEESAFGQRADHTTRLPFKKTADAIRLMVVYPAIHF